MIKRKNTKKQAAKRKPSKKELDDALVAIIASTKRKKRKLNPLEVAEKIETAWDSLESLSKVADRTKISTEMLRQIHSVRKCSEQVKELVRERKLESYDVLHRISKIPFSFQINVAESFIAGELTSEDVRAIVTFHRDFPSIGIRKIIERIKNSRNIKQYVAYFPVNLEGVEIRKLKARFERILGKKNIISFKVDENVGDLVMTKEGRQRLQNAAKRKRVTKRRYIQQIIVRE